MPGPSWAMVLTLVAALMTARGGAVVSAVAGQRPRSLAPTGPLTALVAADLSFAVPTPPGGLVGAFLEEFQHAGDGGLYAELLQDRSFGGTAFAAGLIGDSGGGGGGAAPTRARLPPDAALAALSTAAAGAAARRWPGAAAAAAAVPAATATPTTDPGAFPGPYPPTEPLPRAWAPSEGTDGWVGRDDALPPEAGPRALALRLGVVGAAAAADLPGPPPTLRRPPHPTPRPALPWPPPPAVANPGYWGVHVTPGASFALVSWVRVEGGAADAAAARASADARTTPPGRVVEFALRPLSSSDPGWAPAWDVPPLASALVPVRPALPGEEGAYTAVNLTLAVGGEEEGEVSLPRGGLAAALTVRLLPPAPGPPPPGPPPPGPPPPPPPPPPLPTPPLHPALWLGPTSLFPAANGPLGSTSPFEPTLLSLLAALRPAFLRVPGGCYTEGDTQAHAFTWRTAVAPPLARPGHWNGVWGYWSTDGLGPLEYLSLAEALGAAPLWVAPTGVAHGDGLPPGGVAAVVADVLGLLEFALGDAATTQGGAARTAAGRAAPFPLFKLALGNEGCGKPGYAAAAASMATAVRLAYPQVSLVVDCDPAGEDGVEVAGSGTAGAPSWWAGPPPDAWDWHWYSSSDALFAAGVAGLAPGAGGAPPLPPLSPGAGGGAPAWATEWAAFDWGIPTAPAGSARGAAAEAAFLTGLESAAGGGRVAAAAYAPLLAAARAPGLCPTALIVFDRASGAALTTPSYHVQRLFSETGGAGVAPRVGVWSVEPLNASAAGPPRGVAASITCPDPDCASGALWLRLVNYDPADASLTVQLRAPGPPPARAPALAGPELAATLLAPPPPGRGGRPDGWVSNSFASPAAVAPVPAVVPVTPGASSFEVGLPAWGVAVVEVRLDGGTAGVTAAA